MSTNASTPRNSVNLLAALQSAAERLRQQLPLSLLLGVLFTLPALLAYGLLFRHAYQLVNLLVSGGFVIMIGAVSAPFYLLAQQPARNMLRGINRTAWAIIAITVTLYLIWITDALAIYGIYFGTSAITLAAAGSNPEVAEFMLYMGIALTVITLLALFVSLLAVPHALLRQQGVVTAVGFNVRYLLAQSWLLLPLAALLFCHLLLLTLLPPVEIIFIPLTAYFFLALYETGQPHNAV
ncbi:MAG: hypothetical protein HQL49_05795 [Gammaproteobacteria bacterium]|nr:hypothetical protein [Gammaproteobacteria bacterium]